MSRFAGRIFGDREIADRDQVDCYVETSEPRNPEYYARHGFVVKNPACSWCRMARLNHAAPADGSAGM